MMTYLLAPFQPGFLLHNAFWGSIAVGFFCPLIGVYFMLRRMVLLGVALPQISAAGIAFAFLLQGLGVVLTLHTGEPNDRLLALLGSFVFTTGAIVALSLLEARGEGTTESRIGAIYALAYAVSILFVAGNANGKVEMLSMLNGEIVSVSASDLELLLVAYGILTVLLFLFNRQFLLVSFDRQSAQVAGKNVAFWDLLLYAVIGVAISMSVIIVGPMLTFAFLIVPPLAARRFCKRMIPFFLLSSLIGGLGGFLGFLVSYSLDWPLSPADIAVVSALLFACFILSKAASVFRTRERNS
ncbi:MAG: metal ABC transporter permease [Elusimicrobia bacterium]|nr:metal ABC transporter permease [Elusimicrobiota bacterium]